MRIEEALRKVPASFRTQLEDHPLIRTKRQHLTLAGCLTDPACLKDLYGGLSCGEQQLLSALWLRFGAHSFTTEQAVSIVIEMSKAEVVLGMTELRKLGLLFTARKTWGEKIHCIPKDVYIALLPVLLPDVWIGLEAEFPEQDVDEGVLQHALDSDIFRLLCAIGMRGELKLTQKGTIHKKELQQLTGALQIEKEKLQPVGLQYVHCESYTEAFAVVLDMALRLGLVQQPFQTIQLNVKRLGPWLHMTADERCQVLFELWEKVAYPKELPLQMGWALLYLLEPNRKYSWGQMVNAILTQYPDGTPEAISDQLLNRILLPMAALGWFGMERTDHDWKVWRRQQEAETEHFYIQPNGEIIVPPHLSLPIRWELELLLEKQHSFSVNITRDSVLRACEHGRTGSEIIEFLKAHSMYPLDPSFEQLLREWTSAYGKAQIEEVVLLRFTDKEDADRWLLMPHAETAVAAKLTQTIFILHRDKLTAAEKQLKEINCLPQKKSDAAPVYPTCPSSIVMDADESDTMNTEASRGVVYTVQDLLLYPLDTDIPKAQDMYGELRDIPAMWTNGMRKYHESTMKDVFKKAIELGVKVRLRNASAEGKVAAPRELIEQPSYWNVRCSSEEGLFTVNPREWEEIQLILPGINDKT
ncbi:helicase-associated domain-containing protein [Marinicrinis lubricantis]|uniref:Helicase-associated domain-containing protein n=1 Tax=Marinicrinis lubricantis TaxID=2086470 RepID=A0ABW1IMT0_9BACL